MKKTLGLTVRPASGTYVLYITKSSVMNHKARLKN